MIVGFYTSVDTQKKTLLLLDEFARSEEIASHRDQKGGSIRSTEGGFVWLFRRHQIMRISLSPFLTVHQAFSFTDMVTDSMGTEVKNH